MSRSAYSEARAPLPPRAAEERHRADEALTSSLSSMVDEVTERMTALTADFSARVASASSLAEDRNAVLLARSAELAATRQRAAELSEELASKTAVRGS